MFGLRRPVEDRFLHERVVDHHIGLAQRIQRMQRQQAPDRRGRRRTARPSRAAARASVAGKGDVSAHVPFMPLIVRLGKVANDARVV